MKKLIASIVIIFIVITTISCVAISKKTSSTKNELEKNIVVYTTENNAKMEYIASEFKKTTGITVDYKIVANLNTAVEEAQKSGTNIDAIYGGNKSEFESLAKENNLVKTPVSFSNEITSDYKGINELWYGTSLEPMVMFYNDSYMMPKDAPTEWYQLGLPGYYNRLVLPEVSTSLMSNLLGTMSYKYSKSQVATEFNTFMQGLRNNVLSYYPNEEGIMNAMKTNKEAAISIGELDTVNTAIQNGAPFKVINATDGSPMIMQGVGVVKGAKNINSAKLFIEFIAGPNMQLQLANKFNSVPTIKSILTYAPKWMSNENAVNIANINWDIINPNLINIVTHFNNLTKAPKVEAIKLDKLVIDKPLIPSQQKTIDVKPKVETKVAIAKEKAAVAKQKAEEAAKVKAAKQTVAGKSAMNSLQSLGETSM
ncbi:extracellular solute-binding protein [uncultured Clostridium sp.]|uniref:extracellular solute-binding protein n=1 Tax=uncultured Clostridium sp. TaxID=59620 RepID=UPI00263714A6|nr:extracellular solute-binding protein [uncultured Clostridium sp.]